MHALCLKPVLIRSTDLSFSSTGSAFHNKRQSKRSPHISNSSSTTTIPAMDRSSRDQNPLAPLSFQQYQQQHQQLYQSYSPQRTAITASAVHQENEYEAADWSVPVSLRRSSSADIPIPQFMIPSSVSQLMNKRYALSPSSAASRSG